MVHGASQNLLEFNRALFHTASRCIGAMWHGSSIAKEQLINCINIKVITMVNLCNTRALLAIIAMMVGSGLTGCGGEDVFTTGGADGTGNGGGNGVPGSGAQTGNVANIAITFPYTDAILKAGAGLYQMKGSAFVTDVDGNTVPDGTEVKFKIIDSIKAQGIIDTGSSDSISGAVITDNGATLGDGVTATSFDAAYVIRNNAYEFIDTQDQVFLVPQVFFDPLLPRPGTPAGSKADMARSVASHTGATLTVTSSYANAYPNATYPTGTTGYVIGGSHIGVEVAGIDANDVATTGIGSTIDGVANFKITYPASPATLGLGCIGADPRYLPVGSADVLLMASNSSGSVAVIDEPCLSHIADGTLTPSVTAISGSSEINVLFVDGGDKIPVPFSGIIATVDESGGATLTFDGGNKSVTYITDTSGYIASNVTVTGGATGSKATITYTVDGEPGVTTIVELTHP